MICKHYNRNYSLETITKLCPPSREGASLLGLSEAASLLGFHTISAKIEIRELNEVPLPCILHWNQNHFVVLYKIRKGRKFYIADPGKGLIKYGIEEFKSHWISTRSNGEDKGIAMFLEPTPAFYLHKEEREDERQSNPRSFQFLFGYVRKYKRYFGQIVLGRYSPRASLAT